MDGMPGVLKYGKLTKKALYSLSEGGLLASNVTDNMGHPLVSEPVAPLAEREAQWQRIKGKGAAQKQCVHFKDKAAYARFMATIRNLPLNEMGI